jgi:bifunctional DNA-binding transcriptional regulator/antitoxin component of YhaV-PrlF toxin-antitoxin module
MEVFTVKLDGSARILLPAKVRKQLNLGKGSEPHREFRQTTARAQYSR